LQETGGATASATQTRRGSIRKPKRPPPTSEITWRSGRASRSSA